MELPRYVEEVEAILGETFLDMDDKPGYERAFGSPTLRRHIYQAVCRLLAMARHEDAVAEGAVANGRLLDHNKGWELTTRRVGEIAFRYAELAEPLARMLATIKYAEHFFYDSDDPFGGRLHDGQLDYVEQMLLELLEDPRRTKLQDDLGVVRTYDMVGVLAVAPTGYGKSRLIEAWVQLLATGMELGGLYGCRANRTVLIEPDLNLVYQLHRLLAERFPDLCVGILDGDNKQFDHNLVVSTIDSFVSHFDFGMLGGQPVDAIIVDEGHHMLERLFRQKVIREWRGILMALTATPSYGDELRDAKYILPRVVELTTIKNEIDHGRLNDAQVFTFVVDMRWFRRACERYDIPQAEKISRELEVLVLNRVAAEAIGNLTRTGRRGIVFCPMGDRAKYAKDIATYLETVCNRPSGEPVRTMCMNSYDANRAEVVAAYTAGDIDIITTVNSGREGLDLDIDFVAVVGELVSPLRGRQMFGRGTRRSDRFPTTVYIQVHAALRRSTERQFCLAEAVGGDTFDQGALVQRSNSTGRTRTQGVVRYLTPEDFGDYLADMLNAVDGQPVGEYFAGSANHRKSRFSPDLVSLNTIIAGYDITEVAARRELRKAGYQWWSKHRKLGDGTHRIEYFYRPEAEEYIRANAEVLMLISETELAKQLGVAVQLVRYVAEQVGRPIEPRRRPNPRGSPSRAYTNSECEILKRRMRRVPGMGSGDRALTEVAAELRIDTETCAKWAGVEDGRYAIGGRYHLTAREIAAVTQKCDQYPIGEPTDMILTQIADMAGIDYQVVQRNLTVEDRKNSTDKRVYRTQNGFVIIPTWNRECGEQIAERMRQRFTPRELPCHLLTASGVRRVVRGISAVPKPEVEAVLQAGGYAYEEVLLIGSRGMSKCLSWKAIKYLVEQRGAPRGASGIVLDFSRLPDGPDETDLDKIAYARSIQRRFVSAVRIGMLPD